MTVGFSPISPIFNFTEFYKTYLQISQKSLDVYYNQQPFQFHHPQSPDVNKNAVRAKRKLSTEFEASESKKVRREEEPLAGRAGSVSQTKLTKIMRRRKKDQGKWRRR